MRFEIPRNLGKNSVTHTTSWGTNHEKIKIYKTLIKLRFVTKNPRKKSTGRHIDYTGITKVKKEKETKQLNKWVCRYSEVHLTQASSSAY